MFDFSENRVVKTLDAVPEQFRSLYSKAEDEDEGFVLKGTEETEPLVAALTGAAKALKASRAEAASYKKKVKTVDLTPLKSLGVEGESVEEIAAGIKSQIDELQEQVKGGKEMKVNIEKMKADIARGHATEMEAVNNRSKALETQLYNVLVKNEALTALSDSGVIDPDLVMPFVEKQLRTVEEDGVYKVIVIDGDGDPKFSGSTGTMMTIKELVREMKADSKYGPLFKSEVKKGSGTSPGGPSRMPTRQAPDPSTKLPINKIADGLRARG